MHEKNDFHDVTTWLGDEYKDIPHVSIESKQVEVILSDLVIIPEVFWTCIRTNSRNAL